MRTESLENLFERFRLHGDSAALAELFDRTAQEVLRVAMHMSLDSAQAEDLLQSTFLEAIEKAERFDSSRKLMPWLLGILANLVRREKVKRDRELDPERIHWRQVPGPREAAENGELSHELKRAVDKLPEPYRGVLVFHLLHGLSASEIGLGVGRAPGTVRSQIARGLELLRKALPTGLACTVLLAPVRGLESVRHAVLSRASAYGSALSGTTGTTFGIGALLIMKKIALLSLAATLFAGLFFFDDFFHDTLDANHVAVDPVNLAQERPGTTAMVAEEDQTEIPKRILVPGKGDQTAADNSGSLFLELRWRDDGSPVVRQGIRVMRHRDVNPVGDLAKGKTDSNGVYRVTGLPAGRVYVSIITHTGMMFSIEAGKETRYKIPLDRGIHVEGRVIDSSGKGVGAAELWVYVHGRQVPRTAYHLADSMPDGSFSVDIGPFSPMLGARKDGYAPSLLAFLVNETRGTTLHFDLPLRAGAGSVHGTVHDDDGQPIAGALVLVGPTQTAASHLAGVKQAASAPGVVVRTEDDGTFHVEGVPGPTVLLSARAAGYGTASIKGLKISAGRSSEIDITLLRAVLVTGHVRNAFGKGIRAAIVSHDHGGSFAHSSAKTDARGRFQLEDLSPGKIKLVCRMRGLEPAEIELEAEAGATLRWDPVLTEGLVMNGRVVNEAGTPLSAWRVEVRGYDASWHLSFGTTMTDSLGKFRISNRKALDYRVDVFSPGSRFPTLRKHHQRADKGKIVLTVPDSAMPSAYVQGTVLDAQGKPLPTAGIHLVSSLANSHSAPFRLDAASASFRIGPLPAGRYFLWIEGKGHPRQSLPSIELKAAQNLDLGMISFAPAGSLAAKIEDTQGKAVSKARFRG